MRRKIIGNTVGTTLNPALITEKIEIDDALSAESINPVQNKVVTREVNGVKTQLQNVETTIGNIDVLLGTI